MVPAPYIAEIIKQTTPDGAGRVAAHAVVNAALAVAQGNNALPVLQVQPPARWWE